MLRHAPGWPAQAGGPIDYPWARERAGVGDRPSHCLSCEIELPCTHPSWRGRVRTCNALGAALRDAEAFDRELAALLAARSPAPTPAVPHRVLAFILQPPSRG